MKKTLFILLTLLLLVACGSEKPKSEFTVGAIVWDDHPALNDALDGMVEGLKELGLDDEINVIVKNASNDGANANLIVDQFVNDGVDLIYAIATPAAQTAAGKVDGLDIPVVFNAVTDAVSAGLVKENNNPGVNITGASDAAPLDQQIGLIKEFLPEAKTIGVLYNTSEDNSLHQIESLKDILPKHDLEIEVQGVSNANEIPLALDSIIHKVDTIYIISDNLIAAATAQVVGIANEANKPVFMAEAGQFEHGILASDSISYLNLGKAAATMIKEILVDGKDAAGIAVVIGGETELIVSQKVADLLGIEIPESVLERASIK